MKPQVAIDDLAKLDLRVGEIVDAKNVPDSQKLLELTVDFGAEVGIRTIYSGLKKWYSAESLVGKKFIFIVNLAPRAFKIGETEQMSQGMILAADSNDDVVLICPIKDAANGSKIS